MASFSISELLQGLFNNMGLASIFPGYNGKGPLVSLFNKLTGSGTTGQQDALNAFNAQEAEKNRTWQSDEAEANRRFQAEQAQLDYDRQVEFYEKYQSIGAQIQQYKESGLNPSLLAGGVSPASSAPSASSPSGSMGTGSSASATSPMSPDSISGLIGSIMSIMKMRSEIDVNESVANKNNAEAGKTTKETSWIDAVKGMDIKVAQQKIAESKEKVNEIIASVKVKESEVGLNESQADLNRKEVEIGDHRITLMGSQEALNVTENALKKLEASKLEKLLPYVQAQAQAQLDYTNAKTGEAKASAEKLLYQANESMLKGMVEADLIDKGYYDSYVEQAQWNAKMSKRTYKWSPVNDVCTNFSKVAVGVGSVIGAIKGTGGMPFTSALATAGVEGASEVAPAVLSFF